MSEQAVPTDTFIRESVADALGTRWVLEHFDPWRAAHDERVRSGERHEALTEAAAAIDRRWTTPNHVGQHIAVADWLRARAVKEQS